MKNSAVKSCLIEHNTKKRKKDENSKKKEIGWKIEVTNLVKIELKTAPADFRFPTTNQTGQCFTRYIEFHSEAFTSNLPLDFDRVTTAGLKKASDLGNLFWVVEVNGMAAKIGKWPVPSYHYSPTLPQSGTLSQSSAVRNRPSVPTPSASSRSSQSRQPPKKGNFTQKCYASDHNNDPTVNGDSNQTGMQENVVLMDSHNVERGSMVDRRTDQVLMDSHNVARRRMVGGSGDQCPALHVDNANQALLLGVNPQRGPIYGME
ncbi:hypothetical protein F0562_009232 [Nyssa sinensis]|uniref:Uncharacterized protein n=1 Tax=Nyssa sinensis TaxID=561372 RepID=A0A5J4ZXL1_9ASTE|nr:hypothetical protein F0562_009232 [Nyssa sinensis]